MDIERAFVIGAAFACAASLFAYSWVALRASREEDDREKYLYAHVPLLTKDISGTIFASGMSLATVILTIVQLGIVFGSGLFWAVFTYAFGWFAFSAISKRIKTHCEPRDTIHTFLGRTYNSISLRRSSSILTSIGFVGSFATEILALNIIMSFLGIDQFYIHSITIFFAAFTILYSALGGFQAVIKTDLIQSASIVLVVFIIFGLAVYTREASGAAGLFDEEKLRSLSLPASLFISIFMINVLFPLVDMSAWQRVQASNTVSSFRQGAVIASIGFLSIWSILLFSSFALSGAVYVGDDPFGELVQSAAALPGFFGGLVSFVLIGGLLAALFSTADTFLNAAATTIVCDAFHQNSTESIPMRSVGRLKRLVIGIGAVGFGVVLLLNAAGFGIVELVFALYGGALALAPCVALALFGKKKERLEGLGTPAMLSVLVGFGTAWLVGFYGVLCGTSSSDACTSAGAIVAPNVFQAPTFAFASSLLVLLVGIAIRRVSWRGRKSDEQTRLG